MPKLILWNLAFIKVVYISAHVGKSIKILFTVRTNICIPAEM